MVFDEFLRVVHVGSTALYMGGAVIVTLALRRGLRLIPPAQAGIIGHRVATDFTYLAWLALLGWGGSGYWLLERSGRADFTSPHTLFIDGDQLQGSGWMLVLMISAWLVMVINSLLITFVYRPRLTRRLNPDAAPAVVQRAQKDMQGAVRIIEIMALVNLLLPPWPVNAFWRISISTGSRGRL